MTRLLLSMLATGILLVGGCTSPPRIASPDQEALEGSAWKLESWASEAQDPSKQELYLELGDKGKATIYSAGQSRAAAYDFGQGNDFGFTELPTVVYQGADETESQAERIFYEFLQQTRGYRLDNGKLILEDMTQADLMTFVPRK